MFIESLDYVPYLSSEVRLISNYSYFFFIFFQNYKFLNIFRQFSNLCWFLLNHKFKVLKMYLLSNSSRVWLIIWPETIKNSRRKSKTISFQSLSDIKEKIHRLVFNSIETNIFCTKAISTIFDSKFLTNTVKVQQFEEKVWIL